MVDVFEAGDSVSQGARSRDRVSAFEQRPSSSPPGSNLTAPTIYTPGLEPFRGLAPALSGPNACAP